MKKRILLIHHSGLLGGAGVSLYHTWIALKEKFDVMCYIPSNPPDLLDFLTEKGLRPKTFPFRLARLTYYSGGNHPLSLRFWYNAVPIVFQIAFWKRVINAERPDIVLVNSKVLCWMSVAFKGVKSICFVRETIPGSPKNLMNLIMKSLLERFDGVAFLSEYDRQQTGLRRARAVVSPDFLDIQEYSAKTTRQEACRSLGISSDTFNVLYVGGLNKVKGIEVLLRATRILKEENIRVIIAGYSGDEIQETLAHNIIKGFRNRRVKRFEKRIISYIVENELQDKISFVGIQKDMARTYSACDVLVFPMINPHQARPAFEVGIQRKPVIITDFPNIMEYIKNGINGLVFKPSDAKSLAEAILMLKKDKGLMSQLGNNNYMHTVRYHTKQYAMNSLGNLINIVLNEPQ